MIRVDRQRCCISPRSATIPSKWHSPSAPWTFRGPCLIWCHSTIGGLISHLDVAKTLRFKCGQGHLSISKPAHWAPQTPIPLLSPILQDIVVDLSPLSSLYYRGCFLGKHDSNTYPSSLFPQKLAVSDMARTWHTTSTSRTL